MPEMGTRQLIIEESKSTVSFIWTNVDRTLTIYTNKCFLCTFNEPHCHQLTSFSFLSSSDMFSSAEAKQHQSVSTLAIDSQLKFKCS
jgi:hypothetical protein